MMAAAKIVAGAVLLALAATAGDAAEETPCVDATTTTAIVLRAAAPVALGKGHADASFHLPFAGRTWRVALAWSSARGHTRAGIVVTERADD